ncbi:MAG: hypothetical protein SGI87_08515, partial [Flavobacteriales bacterium]|nr:hypothetical protein [Flavobacteriales bacterium]
YLIEGSFLNGTHGYGLTLLNEQGELLSDTIRWMSDDYHYHLDRFLKLNDDELLMCGALFYNEYDGYIAKMNLQGDILEELVLGNPDD